MKLIIPIQYTRVRFTNIVCTNLDPSFSIIERCKLVAVSRHVNYITAKVILLQLPVTDFQLRVQIMKRANGWKPFLYDLTMGCNFTKKLNPITRLIWQVVKNVTNIKHDCPYNQTLEADHLSNLYVEKALTGLPVPQGEYAFFTTWKSYNVTRAQLKFMLRNKPTYLCRVLMLVGIFLAIMLCFKCLRLLMPFPVV